MPRILIVDDDPTVRASLREALVEHGHDVVDVDDGVAALSRLAAISPDLLLTDVRMTHVGGLELLRTVRERVPSLDVVLMTAYDDLSTVASAMRAGAADFLVKPLSLDQLLSVVDRITEDRRLRSRSAPRPARAGSTDTSLVGRDPRMIEIYKLVGQAAATNATVLIRGESGTGKELVARAIHAHSAAPDEPFIPVNCAALPTPLLESELFGHVRGAFTGAHETRRGRFALAGRGTLFLDEIGDTSLEFQTKLLRVVQDQEFQMVGSEKTERTGARIIFATHQDLERMVGERKFREDLYYRLRVVEIVIPPLRERTADIPLLAAHLVTRAAASLGAPEPVFSPDALDFMMRQAWRGNVRELENCIKRAVVIASAGVIRPEHLRVVSPQGEVPDSLSSLDEVEREQVVRVLAATRNHKGKAAEILGVSRPRLRRLMEKYELE